MIPEIQEKIRKIRARFEDSKEIPRAVDVIPNRVGPPDTHTYFGSNLAWPDHIPRRGVIAFSISAPLGKGSGTVHSVHSCKDQWMSLSVDWLHDRHKVHAVLYDLKRMKL